MSSGIESSHCVAVTQLPESAAARTTIALLISLVLRRNQLTRERAALQDRRHLLRLFLGVPRADRAQFAGARQRGLDRRADGDLPVDDDAEVAPDVRAGELLERGPAVVPELEADGGVPQELSADRV